MLTYTRGFLNYVRDNTAHTSDTFIRTVRNRLKWILRKTSGSRRKHRAGFKNAFHRMNIAKLSIPGIISNNVRSIIGKLDDLTSICSSNLFRNVGIIFLQETWLTAEMPDELISLVHFSAFRSDRPVSPRHRGGGVITYVNELWCTACKCVDSYATKTINCVSVECKPFFLPRFSSIIFVNLYAAPSTTVHDWNAFCDHITCFISSFSQPILIVIAGDFNQMDTLPFISLGLSNIISRPTRLGSCLDKILTNDPTLFHHFIRSPLGTSDHSLLHVVPKIYSSLHKNLIRPLPSRTLRRHRCSPDNILALNTMLCDTDFSIFHHSDLSTHCSVLTDYLKFCFEVCCPLETFYIRPDRFSSPLLKQLRRKKERFYKSGRFSHLKSINQQIRTEIRRLNALYVDAVTGKRDCREMWKLMKFLIHGSTKSSLPSADLNSLNVEFTNDAHDPLPPTLFPPASLPPFEPTSGEVFSLLKSCNASKASGPDGLLPILLKSCAGVLTHPISSLFRRCLLEQRIPSDWKIARITPVPKPSSNKFRPIACSSVLLKMFEKLILTHMSDSIPFSDPSQFAFKHQRSTLDAVATLVNFVSSTIDKQRKPVRMIFLDYSNAFGSLDRLSLLNDLDESGASSSLLALLSDYFSQRSQFTRLRGQNSDLTVSSSGVLQGAILSPFLFSFYLRQLPCHDCIFSAKYADDVVLAQPIPSCLSTSSLQDCLNDVVCWSESRSLMMNDRKCLDMVFTPSSRGQHSNLTDSLPPLLIQGQSVPIGSAYRYLGVTLSPNLSWSDHVQSLFSKVRGLSFFALKLKLLSVPPHLLKRFVLSCIAPLWLYCSPVVFPGLLKKDFVLISRSIKLVARRSGMPRSFLVSFIVEKHVAACMSLAFRIINDPEHPLHLAFSECISSGRTRSQYILLPSRTSLHRNSVLPYLSRLLVMKDNVQNALLEDLMC